MKCGFKIGGGIDQDFTKSPQGYTDNVRYIVICNNTLYTDLFIYYFNITQKLIYKFEISFQGIYVTEVHEGSPAAKSGLRMHDKILQCNGYDFTMVTHKKAVSYIRKHPVLNLLVARKGVTST